LLNEADRWEDDDNAIVRVAKEMSRHITSMMEAAHVDPADTASASLQVRKLSSLRVHIILLHIIILQYV